MKVALTFLITVFTATATMAAGPVCKTIFATPEAEREAVEKTIKELSALRLEIDQKNAAGDRSVTATALDHDFHTREKNLLESLKESKVMTAGEYIQRMRLEMARLQDIQRKRDHENDREREDESRRKKEQEAVTRNSIKGARVVLHRIEPGRFKMGDNKVDKTITEAFEMMETPTSQFIWESVLVLAARRFGEDAYKLDRSPSKNKGEFNPVEMVSYDEITLWLKALNELSVAGDPGLVELIPSHKRGDSYRLPTNEEWEFVLHGRGQFDKSFFFGNDLSRLSDYAWHSQNSHGVTQPVGMKKPLAFEGKEFFDMLGNVYEWVLVEPPPLAEADPIGNALLTGMGLTRGGSVGNEPDGLLYLGGMPAPTGDKRSSFGFRFIREERK